MQSSKKEQLSIWRTCRKRKTVLMCRADLEGVVLYEVGLLFGPIFLGTIGPCAAMELISIIINIIN